MTSTPADTHTDSPVEGSRFSPTDLALIAAFAALISACAYIGAVPTGGAVAVPITLQTFGVMLAGCVLGPVRGFLAAGLYLVLGVVGLPVFAEHTSGLGVFSGPSVGYLYSFPVAALVGGLLVKYVARERRTRAVAVFLCSLTASILIIHTFGIVGLMNRFDITLEQAYKADRVFWLGDLLKTTLVAIVAAEVHRAFPQLLRRR